MIDLPASTTWQPVVLPNTHTSRFQAQSNGELYHVWLSVPESAPPDAGYPLLCVLDADEHFVSMEEALRRAGRRPESTGVGPVVLLGVDQAASDRSRNQVRRRDYTAGSCADGAVTGPAGGAVAFLEFLCDELMPTIEAHVRVDPRRRGLFGHSMAGYFALWVLATTPRSFSHYAAISPSMWWDREALDVRLSAEALVTANPRVYLAAGEWEGEPAPWQHALAADPVGMERRKRRCMIPQAREFAGALSGCLGAEAVQFDLLPGEDHGSVLGPATSRVLRFIQG